MLNWFGETPIQAEARSEKVLLAAARRGDRQAFDALVRAYRLPLRGFLARRVGPEAVDDVLQETWLAAWTALSRFSGRARFKAWLFGIAVHKCTDSHRMRGRHAAEIPFDPDLPYPTQRDLYDAAELKETVQALLTEMPETQREVLEMYYYAELTLPEIAGALSRNLNTVKYQFYRAHAHAAAQLRTAFPDQAASAARREGCKRA